MGIYTHKRSSMCTHVHGDGVMGTELTQSKNLFDKTDINSYEFNVVFVPLVSHLLSYLLGLLGPFDCELQSLFGLEEALSD